MAKQRYIDVEKAWNEAHSDAAKERRRNIANAFMQAEKLDSTRASDLEEVRIPLENIEARGVNEFQMLDVDGLKESIKNYGLIHAIAVVHHEGEDRYVISSGHRRFMAYKSLHEEYPDEKLYQTIPATIYTVTEDPELLASSEDYITPEEEEAMYRDANFQSRQITDKDILKNIDYLVDTISKRGNRQAAIDKMIEDGKRQYRGTVVNDATFISHVLTNDMKYRGWGEEKVRRYLYLRENAPEEVLEKVKNGELTIRKAYDDVRGIEKEPVYKPSTSDITKQVKKLKRDIKKGRKLTNQEVLEIKDIYDSLGDILNQEKKKK